MRTGSDAERLIRTIVDSLVEFPDDVRIERKESGEEAIYEVTVHADDVGKVVGRQGRIVKAIRTLARAAGSAAGEQVHVEVLG